MEGMGERPIAHLADEEKRPLPQVQCRVGAEQPLAALLPLGRGRQLGSGGAASFHPPQLKAEERMECQCGRCPPPLLASRRAAEWSLPSCEKRSMWRGQTRRRPG